MGYSAGALMSDFWFDPDNNEFKYADGAVPTNWILIKESSPDDKPFDDFEFRGYWDENKKELKMQKIPKNKRIKQSFTSKDSNRIK